MPYNLDLKLQRFQSDMKVYTKTSRYPLRVNMIIDYKAVCEYTYIYFLKKLHNKNQTFRHIIKQYKTSYIN